MVTLPKIIAIIGPTASGKSGLAIQLAKRFNGEIISADSRQIYKGLDIGTGKITEKEMDGVPHHLLDIINPDEDFSVARFKEIAENAVDDILSRNKLPIIAGGTGFYVEAVVHGVIPPEVPPNSELRKRLSELSTEDLLEQLSKLDSRRAEEIGKDNSRRIIRAIEIAEHLGQVPARQTSPKYNALQIGVEIPREKLKENIRRRVQERLEEGWVEEVSKLLKTGISIEKIKEFGLGYYIIARNLTDNPQPTTDNKKLTDEISTAEWRYAKRQMTWFKRDKDIWWASSDNIDELEKRIDEFLK